MLIKFRICFWNYKWKDNKIIDTTKAFNFILMT